MSAGRVEGLPGKSSETNNGDLLDKHCLERWYDAEQLGSDLARETFCLPGQRR